MKKRGARVLLGLSGGVDSALAALILQKQGFEVIAARMSVYNGPDLAAGSRGGCYGRSDVEDTASAAALAHSLKIPFSVIDVSLPFSELVLENFRGEYLAGRTPNPCIRCNELIKFGKFPELALESGLDFDYIATGHYARVVFCSEGTNIPDPEGQPRLWRGCDQLKDQSYFLYRLSREQLSRTIFPLGELTKVQTRQMAAQNGLSVHDRPDSQDFYGGNYLDLLSIKDREGRIVDSSGKELGRHQGCWRFTPGQRKGLGVCSPEPLYVLKIDAGRNEVVVGPSVENAFGGCFIHDFKFLQPHPPSSGTILLARLRSSQPLIEVKVGEVDSEGRLEVEFLTPQSGLAPGQSLVLYEDQMVVGGGQACAWAN